MNDKSLQSVIDRYVDNELSAEQVTALLHRLDTEPDAWKTCALSLIEALEVRSALREFVNESGSPPPAQNHGPWQRHLFTVSCATALIIVAFFGGRMSSTESGGSRNVAEYDESEPKNSAVVAGSSNVVESGGHVSKIKSLPAAMSVVGFAQLHRALGAGPKVPVISGPELDFEELVRQPPPVPDHVLRQAGNNGLRIESVRHVMALELADGQKLAIPLDSVGVHYVGHSVL